MPQAVKSVPNIIKTNDFAGYAVTPKSAVTVAATFTVPVITCTSTTSGLAVGVYVAGPIRDSQTQAFVALHCDNGKAIDVGAIAINGKLTVLTTAISPSDSVAVSISESPTAASATLKDVTTGVTTTLSGGGGGETQVLVGDVYYNQSTPVAKLTSNRLTAVKVGGQRLGSLSPTPAEWVKGKTVQAWPTAITGGNSFNVLFKHAS